MYGFDNIIYANTRFTSDEFNAQFPDCKVTVKGVIPIKTERYAVGKGLNEETGEMETYYKSSVKEGAVRTSMGLLTVFND